jgi:hypothetical protein
MVNRGLATVSSESDGGSRVRSPLIEGERKNRSLAAPRQKQLITSSSQARKVKDRFSGDQVTEDELKQFCRAKLLRIDPSRRSEFPELEDGPEPKRVRRISPHKKMIVFNLLSVSSIPLSSGVFDSSSEEGIIMEILRPVVQPAGFPRWVNARAKTESLGITGPSAEILIYHLLYGIGMTRTRWSLLMETEHRFLFTK